MGKMKSDSDLLREQFFQKQSKRRRALLGPFGCPKCQADKKLQCRTVSKDVKEMRTPVSGKPYEITAKYTDFIFYCTGCHFSRKITRRAGADIIDVYSTLYDEELSAASRDDQLGMVRDRRQKVIKLPEGSVRMR